jgi:hypothetical protein
MNNSSITENIVKCNYISVTDFISKYIMNIVSIFGIIANLICIMIFIKIIKTTQSQGNMYKYFLMKSIMDCLTLIINSFQYLKYCSNCDMAHSYLIQIWYIWFYFYFAYIVESSSVIFEMAAILDCYIRIKSIFKCCQTNLFFYLFCIFVIAINVIINLLMPLSFQITSEIGNNNETFYNADYNDFGKSSYASISFFNSLIKDGLFFLIIFILNVMILTLLKSTTDRRRSLGGNNNTLSSTSLVAERKKIIMIAATGLNYMIGHFPIIYWCVSFAFSNETLNCYSLFFLVLYYISFADSIFFYFFFNNIFKKILIEYIPFINRNTS